MTQQIKEEAFKWVFETNSHKWSNNNDTAGDNAESFIAGANSKYVQKEKIKAQIEVLEECRKRQGHHLNILAIEIADRLIEELQQQLNELQQ